MARTERYSYVNLLGVISCSLANIYQSFGLSSDSGFRVTISV
jgi:hypothetical protein